MRKIITLLIALCSVVLHAAESPMPLVNTREWTRAADQKKITADLVHVRGTIAILQVFDKLIAVEKNTLDAESIKLIDAAKPPVICCGLLYKAPLSDVEILLGKPARKSESYIEYQYPDFHAALKIQDGRVVQVTASAEFASIEDVRQRLGIAYMPLGQTLKKGIFDRWFMASTRQGIWEVFCTPGDEKKYILANVVMPLPAQKKDQ